MGTMALANNLLTDEKLTEPELKFPLDLVFCPECSLIQITETVPPAILFSEYLYFSSFSETMLRHARDLVEKLTERCSLNNNSLVIELGSNDGYLLQYFVEKNIPVLGIEPARNICKIAEEKGVNTICEFFSADVAQKLKDKYSADIIIMNNVMAHIADLSSLVDGIRILLKRDGIAVIEVPYVKDMIDKCEFDTIYHEHLCYFSVTALNSLFKRHGLLLVDIERLSIHGGSLRLYVAHDANERQSKAVLNLLRDEEKWGVNRIESYREFGRRVENVKESLLSLLKSLKQKGMRIAGYGAAAKSTVLLNYCNIGPETVDFVADLSPYKQGHYIPGMHIPIKSPAAIVDKKPDYILLFVWNIKDEILKQQSKYRENGGKFIIPLPQVEII